MAFTPPVGGFTVGQLQFGAAVEPVCWQPLASVMVKLMLVLAAILLSVKPPLPFGVTAAVAVTTKPPAPPLGIMSVV